MAFASIDLPEPRIGTRVHAAEQGDSDGVAIARGAAGLGGLEADWREISGRAGDTAAFLGFGYALAAARFHEARGEKVVVAVAHWLGRPAAAVAVVLLRRAGVTIGTALGDPVTQYSDALLAADAPRRLVGLALRAIAEAEGVHLFDFRRVRAESPLTPALAAMTRADAVRAEAPYADLTRAADVSTLLLEVAGAKHRRERARSRRRLAERGDLAFEVFRGEAAVGPLAEAFRVKGDWLARNGHFSRVIEDPAALALLQEAGRDPVEGASLVVARLSVGGAPAAYEVGLVRGRRFHAYLGAVVHDFAGASPGKVVMEDALGWAKAEGLETYDLLAPADRYKREWSTGAVAVRDFVAPMSWKGRLYAGPWHGTLRPALRRSLDGLPPVVRRVAARAAAALGIR
ncbi:GNAT family N-acetyltransferase [Chenggangzhangella methanolivorans]|uniref:GNAT family N-acetyltransferase n=1 Tax=Chenggangzhangella methanolivorans TaxID=1437009 RepID=A0A9E6RA71_9HYPH|nr:GNAT family N-acetyltransferase [Chenggangzhangella methanolivorans]QZN99487.1 GNAT family N-acetyltransferase [Chenggangzhangella methanolivorans]